MKIGNYNLIYIIYERLFKKNMAFFIPFIYFISVVLLLLSSLYCGTLVSTSNQQGYLQDIGALVGVGLVGLPFLALYMIYFIDNIPKLLINIVESPSIKITREERKLLLLKYEKRVNSKLNNLIIIPAFFANFVWIFALINSDNLSFVTRIGESGKQVLMFDGYIYIFVMTVFFYTIGITVINLISTILLIKNLSKNCEVEINPLHPDNCGGLSSIGKLGYVNSLPIIIIGVGIVTILINDVFYLNIGIFTFYHIAIVGVYLLASVIFFFLPFMYYHMAQRSFPWPLRN